MDVQPDPSPDAGYAPGVARRQRLRRDESQALTREALMEAAARLFEAKGLAATSITDIVDEAGYTTGALYSNFANKEELFVAVLERQVATEMATLQAALTAEPGVEGRLRIVGEWYASQAGDGPRRIRSLAEIALLARNPEAAHARLRERLAALHGAVEDLLRQQETELGFTFQMPTPILATALLALLQGFGLRAAIEDDDEVDPAPLIAALRLLLVVEP